MEIIRKDVKRRFRAKKVQAGDRFSRLVVVSRIPRDEGSSRWWHVACDCGNATRSTSARLHQGTHKSCGCLKIELAKKRLAIQLSRRKLLPPGESAFNNMYYLYKRSATENGREFLLSKDHFRVLTQSPCTYCGESPQTSYGNKKTHGTSYIGNGIDRLDNRKGYTEKNSVPCCTLCNFMKRKLTLENFKKHIEKIYNNMGSL